MNQNPYESPHELNKPPAEGRFGYADFVRWMGVVFPVGVAVSVFATPVEINPLITQGILLAFGAFCFTVGLVQGRIGRPR